MFPDIILPIAQLEISPLIILVVGLMGGFVSSFLGVGSGIVVTPVLIAFGIPPIVALASQLHNSVGTNFIGFLGYWRKRDVDFGLAWYIFIGGVCGAFTEMLVLRMYQGIANIYREMAMVYVFILGFLGTLMLIQNIRFAINPKPKDKNVVMREWMIYFPVHRIFTRSRVEMSVLIPFGVGYLTGLFTSTLGGGNTVFIMPIVCYLIGRSSPVVAGTSLLAGAAISIVVIIFHSATTSVGDVVLVYFLIFGSFIGSQIAVNFRYYFPQNVLGGLGGAFVLGIAFKFAYDAFLDDEHSDAVFSFVKHIDHNAYSFYAKKIAMYAQAHPIPYGLIGLFSIIITAYILERITRYLYSHLLIRG